MTRDLVMDIQDFQMRLAELQTTFNNACADYDVDRIIHALHLITELIIEARKVVNLTYAEQHEYEHPTAA